MEIWKDIAGFSGYQISSEGRVRTFRKRKHYPTGYGAYWSISDEPTIMSLSDDGNGYAKVMMYGDDGNRYCKKVHRLVAEAFIPHAQENDTVDHITSGLIGKRDNSVSNLRWIPRSDNVRKAYRDGMHDNRITMSRKPIVLTDIWTGEELYFDSVVEAAQYVGRHYTTILHALENDYGRVSHYYVERAGREERMLYGNQDY